MLERRFARFTLVGKEQEEWGKKVSFVHEVHDRVKAR